MKFVSLRRERTRRRGMFDKPSRVTLKSFTNRIATSPQIHTGTEFQQQVHHDPLLWIRDVISQRSRFLFTHGKQLAAIIAVLTFLFGLALERVNVPRATAKLPVLRYAKTGAAVERARAT